MSLNPGKLDRKLAIQKRTDVADGMGGITRKWADFATIWAEKVSTTGREFRADGALRAETTDAFRIRYISKLTPGDYRIIYSEPVPPSAPALPDKIYDILHIAEEGRREKQLIQARSTEAAP